MRVVHLSTWDIAGGAAKAAYRLHRGLIRVGIDSSMLVLQKSGDDSNVDQYRTSANISTRVIRRLRGETIIRGMRRYLPRPSGYELFSDDRSKHGGRVADQIPPCDVVNLHWVAGFVDYRLVLEKLGPRVPVVWTLHDMNPFTGGCHYDLGCGRYAEKCGACPQLGSTDTHDLSRQIWERKLVAFRKLAGSRSLIVAASHWLAHLAKSSSLLKDVPIATIHYGVDTELFSPRDKLSARSALGIEPEAKVVLFVAESLENRRKGLIELAQVLEGLEVSNLLLLLVGARTIPVRLPIPSISLGSIESERLLALVYSAADVLVSPSLQDNFPLTVLESIACGTPVAAFNSGGVREVVRPGVTGKLVSPGDVAGLRAAICELLTNSGDLARLRANCRKMALSEFQLETQAKNYSHKYEDLISRSGLPVS